MPEMEGILYKWTNYVSGWQPRWFILDKGILAYYKSQDEVGQGCKGSVKLACCEIDVHGTDPTRVDLIIPGEQHFYVKGTSEAERQRWLVALGSAKACLTDSIVHQGKEESDSNMRSKMSELRLYCDLLMQQVASVKEACEEREQPDVEKLNQSTSLLSQTCGTFIDTLENCMQLANSSLNQHNSQNSVTDAAILSSVTPERKRTSSLRGHAVEDRYTPPTTNKYGIQTRYHNLEDMASRPRRHRSGDHARTSSTSSAESVPVEQSKKMSKEKSDTESRTSIKEKNEEAEVQTTSPRYKTFFSELQTKFSDIKLNQNDGIPTSTFLDACVCIVGIFDALNGTAFAPVKMDINGNIRKIRQKYKSDPDAYGILQDIVQQEVKDNTTTAKNSATDALMWLRRSLQFIKEMIKEISAGETDLNVVSNNAYSKSLKSYHGWVVRGIFALAAKAAPHLEDFIYFIAVNKEDIEKNDFMPSVIKDLSECGQAMEKITDILIKHYVDHNIESSDQV
ncbi:pleckstrin homology domain-containing family A member 8-like isoform X1 [Apostichopus japonicus]|uniref:pleckstrin homology domain-containing family A member 8-like isoform X1 n=2 Tax=Stichopus japonicus TaxID=307972 RepID=UPI003AB7E0B2